MDNLFWHHLKIEEVLNLLKTDKEKGLTSEEVLLRKEKYGLNQLPPEKEKPLILIFLSQFLNPLVYILIFGGFLTLIFHDYLEGIFIFIAVFINALFGFFQENKAKKILSQIKKSISHFTTVIRDGHLKEVPHEDLVVGDIIFLKAGAKIPADARVIEAQEAKVNESILTGEWLPSEKEDVILKKETPLAERKNMIFMGTDLVKGRIKAVVVETGIKTEIGKIGKALLEIKEEKTPLQKRIAYFSKNLAFFIGIFCFLIFLDGLINKFNFLELLITMVAVVSSAIPEGLPITLTIVLALGVKSILKRGGLVKNLSSVETLGGASVICMDKTGTLTKGEMKIKEILGDNEKEIIRIALLNSDAYLENPEEKKEKWSIKGDSEEKAILEKGLEFFPYHVIESLKKNIILNFPFDSSFKYSACLLNEGKDFFLYIVGAPERILSLSLNKFKDKWEKIIEQKTEEGYRIIACAYRKITKKQIIKNQEFLKKKIFPHHLIKNLQFSGILLLEDPLREEVKEALKVCSQAGIQPVIVSGDHKKTVKKILKEANLEIDDSKFIDGYQLDKLSDLEIENQINDFKVIYRAEPKHKLKIVEMWQRKNKVVAMTGDGVNDALALKKADIGIALHSGTEIAKVASDLILLNDSFLIILKAIEEGRKILANFRKIITYFLVDTFTEVILIGFSIFFRWPLPFLPAQVLWVNIIEDTLPAIALAFERENGLLEEKPEVFKPSLFTKEMVFLIFIIGLLTDFLLISLFYFLVFYSSYPLNHIRTIIFAAIGIDSLFLAFSLKSLKKNLWHINIASNPLLIFSFFIGLFLMFLPIYFEPFHKVLKLSFLNLFDWYLIFLIGIINLLLVEFGKWLFIRKKYKK